MTRDKAADELREEARLKVTNRNAAVLSHLGNTCPERGPDRFTFAILMGRQDPSMLAKVYQHLSFNPQHLLDEAQRAAT